MIIANFGGVGKSGPQTTAGAPSKSIREHHEIRDTFVVYDVQPCAPLTCG